MKTGCGTDGALHSTSCHVTRLRPPPQSPLPTLCPGRAGKPCSLAAPQCPYSERELVAATEDLGITRDPGLDSEDAPRSRWRRQTRPRRQHGLQVRRRRVRGRPRPLPSHNRRQSVLGRMPPIFRPRGSEAREVCRTCDVRGNVCSVYGIGVYCAPCTKLLRSLLQLLFCFKNIYTYISKIFQAPLSAAQEFS